MTLLDVRGQAQLIFNLTAGDAKRSRLVETGPPGAKLVDRLRAYDPIMGTCEAPVFFWLLNRATQNRSVECGGARVARWQAILAVLISKSREAGLLRGDAVVHAGVTLIAADRG